MGLARSIRALLKLIQFHHTVFALPFALLSMLWASGGAPGWRVLGLVVLAMVGARSAAMTFNRLADREYDARNPRTTGWPLGKGEVSLPLAWFFFALSVGLFEAAAWALNPLCFALSPLALLVLLGYSYTKRFTWLCHWALGFADGLAAPGAWLAVTGTPVGSGPSWWLCAALTFWIAGFDLLYALQDVEFDRAEGLHSLPARFGIVPTLSVSSACHTATVGLLAASAWAAGVGWVFWCAVGASALLLAYEHAIIRPSDLSRLDRAFFSVNGYFSVGLLLLGWLDLALR